LLSPNMYSMLAYWGGCSKPLRSRNKMLQDCPQRTPANRLLFWKKLRLQEWADLMNQQARGHPV